MPKQTKKKPLKKTTAPTAPAKPAAPVTTDKSGARVLCNAIAPDRNRSCTLTHNHAEKVHTDGEAQWAKSKWVVAPPAPVEEKGPWDKFNVTKAVWDEAVKIWKTRYESSAKSLNYQLERVSRDRVFELIKIAKGHLPPDAVEPKKDDDGPDMSPTAIAKRVQSFCDTRKITIDQFKAAQELWIKNRSSDAERLHGDFSLAKDSDQSQFIYTAMNGNGEKKGRKPRTRGESSDDLKKARSNFRRARIAVYAYAKTTAAAERAVLYKEARAAIVAGLEQLDKAHADATKGASKAA